MAGADTLPYFIIERTKNEENKKTDFAFSRFSDDYVTSADSFTCKRRFAQDDNT